MKTLLDGIVETHYRNGQLEQRSNYKAGELDGLIESYYEDGQLSIRANYKAGERID